jgi:hypothetical protein
MKNPPNSNLGILSILLGSGVIVFGITTTYNDFLKSPKFVLDISYNHIMVVNIQK